MEKLEKSVLRNKSIGTKVSEDEYGQLEKLAEGRGLTLSEWLRELALEVDTSFASRRVTRVLEAIVAERGQPLAIRCDNGPELTSRHFLAWCVERQIELVHIQGGWPRQA
jgi:hypothetical protein